MTPTTPTKKESRAAARQALAAWAARKEIHGSVADLAGALLAHLEAQQECLTGPLDEDRSVVLWSVDPCDHSRLAFAILGDAIATAAAAVAYDLPDHGEEADDGDDDDEDDDDDDEDDDEDDEDEDDDTIHDEFAETYDSGSRPDGTGEINHLLSPASVAAWFVREESALDHMELVSYLAAGRDELLADIRAHGGLAIEDVGTIACYWGMVDQYDDVVEAMANYREVMRVYRVAVG